MNKIHSTIDYKHYYYLTKKVSKKLKNKHENLMNIPVYFLADLRIKESIIFFFLFFNVIETLRMN